MGRLPITSVWNRFLICSGSRTELSRTSARTAKPTASSVEHRNASSTFSFRFGKTGLMAARAGSAMRMELF